MKEIILNIEAARRLDQRAFAEYGIPSLLLMDNAGRALADQAREAFGENFSGSHFLIFCGAGNNGGDGFAAARHLFQRGADVSVVLAAEEAKFAEDASLNYRMITTLGIQRNALKDLDSHRGKWAGKKIIIVDALIGTGFRPPLKPEMREAINRINQIRIRDPKNVRVLSADIPSGLNGDTGPIGTVAVKADTTVTFACLKPGLLKPESKEFVGDIKLADIGIPEQLLENIESSN